MPSLLRIALKSQWQVKWLLLLLVVFCGSGATCSRAFRNPFASVGPPAPHVLVAGASLEQVIDAVNLNAGRIQSYQTNDASITVQGMTGIPVLRGNIAAQRPGRLRLQASTALTGPEVDIGSNDEHFWFWVRRNEPPALYFSRHDRFAGSAAQEVLPINPKWLLDAIGMVQLSRSDQHQGPLPHGDGTLEVRTVFQADTGMMTKSTVIDAQRAWVLQQHVYDSGGTLLASCRARSHRYYPELGVSLPQEIDIHLPAVQMSLTIDVGNVVLNHLTNNDALWTLPVLDGYPQIDLGTAQPGTFSAIGGTLPGFVASESALPTAAASAVLPETPDQTYPLRTSAVPPMLPVTPAATNSMEPWVQPVAQPVTQQLPPGGIPAFSGELVR